MADEPDVDEATPDTEDEVELPENIPMAFDDCCVCGTRFGMQVAIYNARKADTKLNFYCPNGHQLHYPAKVVPPPPPLPRDEEIEALRAELAQAHTERNRAQRLLEDEIVSHAETVKTHSVRVSRLVEENENLRVVPTKRRFFK